MSADLPVPAGSVRPVHVPPRRPVDVAVDPVLPDPVDQAVRRQHGGHLRLHAGQAQVHRTRGRQLVELAQLRRPLRVDEVHALEVEHEGAQARVAVDDRADALVQRLGRREEEAAVDADHRDTRDRSRRPGARRGRGTPVSPPRDPGSASTGRVATWISQTSDSTMPTRHPGGRRPTAPRGAAAIAIQKSNRFTRRSRRNSATSIIPNTTASMMIAARTALGSSENTGASRISVAMTIPPVASDATGVRAPADSFSELAERLVETGMPWKTPAPTLAIPCATDSWFRSMR